MRSTRACASAAPAWRKAASNFVDRAFALRMVRELRAFLFRSSREDQIVSRGSDRLARMAGLRIDACIRRTLIRVQIDVAAHALQRQGRSPRGDDASIRFADLANSPIQIVQTE